MTAVCSPQHFIVILPAVEEEDLKADVKTQLVESLVKDKSRVVTNIEPAGVRPRKPCNCTKSQCLKLYCDCFANGEFLAQWGHSQSD